MRRPRKRVLWSLIAAGIALAVAIPAAVVRNDMLTVWADAADGPRQLYLPNLAADSAPPPRTCPELEAFSFAQALSGPARSLAPFVESASRATGAVTINGGDSRQPQQPFTFAWGDGSSSEAFFPAAHTYSKTHQNYTIQVTAHYQDGTSAEVSLPLWFVPPLVVPVTLDEALAVTIPASPPALGTRLYPVPSGLVAVGGDALGGIPRGTAEYLFSVAAQRQHAFANGDVLPVLGAFRQVVLRDPSFVGGMYSLWFTTPVALAVGGGDSRLESQLSSVLHEMGHNVTLNSPAGFSYGGRIDGNANAVFSETMAQIYQHATVYDLVRDGAAFGLGCDVRDAIAASGLASFGILRLEYEKYVGSGSQFRSWNAPSTSADETLGTFMTIAFKFFEHAEARGEGVVVPLRRMMRLLQSFDPATLQSYDPLHDTPEASSFRATLMVAALAEAFDSDLRAEFRALGFPIDDAIYIALRSR